AGTPLYMAPEAFYGGPIDERTDVYSLGVVFYEMLTARHPFAAGSLERVLERMMQDTPRPAAELNPAVSPALSRVVERMLERDRGRRFDSCASVREALLAARRGDGAGSRAEETPAPAEAGVPPRSARGLRIWAWAALGLSVAALATWRLVAAPRLPAERHLAILPPTTSGATEDFAAYGLGATELLSIRLMRHQDQPGFQMAAFNESYQERLA